MQQMSGKMQQAKTLVTVGVFNKALTMLGFRPA
jgi:hypothetical protein